MSEFVDFTVDGHTMYNNGEYAGLDAMVRITVLLHEMGLVYEEHWNIFSSHYDNHGRKILRLEFYNASDAMLAKLNGLANG